MSESNRFRRDLVPGLVTAAFMVAVPLLARIAARQGWTGANEVAARAPMAIVAAFIVATGNTLPKRLPPLRDEGVEGACNQSFFRFAGWTWVLTGLAFGLAWLFLPQDAAATATLVILPLGIALIAFRWFRARTTARPTP